LVAFLTPLLLKFFPPSADIIIVAAERGLKRFYTFTGYPVDYDGVFVLVGD